MTTSIMTYTWQNVIDDALYQAGKKDIGNAAETELVEIATRALNGMLKYWQSRGVQLHTIDTVTIKQYSSKQSYTIKLVTGDILEDRPMRIISASRRDNDTGYDIPINVISYEEYDAITIKSTTGPVTQVACTKAADSMTVYVWPVSADTVGDEQYSVILTTQRPVNVAESGSLNATPDFPSEQYLAAVYGLADIMSKGANPKITAKATQYFNEMLATDQENISIFWQPETR